MYQSRKKLFWRFNRNIRFGVPWTQKGFICQKYTFMYVCSATDYWIDFHPTRDRHITVRAFRPQHKMVRRVSEAAGRAMAERWAEIEYIYAFCFDLYIYNHHQFLHNEVSEEEEACVSSWYGLFVFIGTTDTNRVCAAKCWMYDSSRKIRLSLDSALQNQGFTKSTLMEYEYYESLRVVSKWKGVAPFILIVNTPHNIVTLEIIKTLHQHHA